MRAYKKTYLTVRVGVPVSQTKECNSKSYHMLFFLPSIHFLNPLFPLWGHWAAEAKPGHCWAFAFPNSYICTS